jgi:hypothetical protein
MMFKPHAKASLEMYQKRYGRDAMLELIKEAKENDGI